MSNTIKNNAKLVYKNFDTHINNISSTANQNIHFKQSKFMKVE